MNHKVIDSSPEVLFEDKWLFIVHKEKEELTVPGRGDDKKDCLMSRAALWLGEVYNIHRLDQPTSGLVVLGRNQEAQKEMSRLFERRLIRKIYRARVKGQIEEDEGLINLPLRADRENRPKQIVDTELGKPAQTEWVVIDRQSDWTDLDLYPATGRTHQLRVHLAAIGHPILGDRLYNDDTPADLMDKLCLHAMSLEFVHPFTGEKVTVEKPVDF